MKPASSKLQTLINLFYRELPEGVASEGVTDQQIENFVTWYNRAQAFRKTYFPGVLIPLTVEDLTKTVTIGSNKADIKTIISYLASDDPHNQSKSKVIMGYLLDINKNKSTANFNDQAITLIEKAIQGNTMTAFDLAKAPAPANVFPEDVKAELAKMMASQADKARKKSIFSLAGGKIADAAASAAASVKERVTGTTRTKSPSEEIYDFLAEKGDWKADSVPSGTRLAGPIVHVSIGKVKIPQSALKEIIDFVVLKNKLYLGAGETEGKFKALAGDELKADVLAKPKLYLDAIDKFAAIYVAQFGKNNTMDDIAKVYQAQSNANKAKTTEEYNRVRTYADVKHMPSESEEKIVTTDANKNFMGELQKAQKQRTGSESPKSSSKPMPPPLPKQGASLASSSAKPTPPPLPPKLSKQETQNRLRSDSDSSNEGGTPKAKRPLPPPPPSSPKKIPPRPTNYPKR